MSGQYTTRRSLLKQLQMGKGNLETALEHFNRVRDKLNSEHPELAAEIEKVMVAVVYTQAALDIVYKKL